MKFIETSTIHSLNKSTYTNLRWIAYIGQLIAILVVEFFLQFSFNYLLCLLIVFLSILTNLYLHFKIKQNQLSNFLATLYLSFDIAQLGCLIYLTGGITNPFIILLIIPSIFSSQYLNIWSSVLLSIFTILLLALLTFNYYELPHPEELHFHAPQYYLYSLPVSIAIGLVFLVYFGAKFGRESQIRKKAYEEMQEQMAKENELLSLGGQAAAAAHSLGTPLSTILLTSKELRKEFGDNQKINKDIELLISQSERCRDILKKLSLNPTVEDDFINSNLSLFDYIYEIIRSYQEISNKIFKFDYEQFKNPIKLYKPSEIIYGLRNFIGNANKFSKKNIKVFLESDNKETKIVINDDGPGFPKDLIDKQKLGEPYIRTTEQAHNSKYGLGLGTFIGKTLLEKNFANINFMNSKITGGAEVIIKWKNNELIKI